MFAATARFAELLKLQQLYKWSMVASIIPPTLLVTDVVGKMVADRRILPSAQEQFHVSHAQPLHPTGKDSRVLWNPQYGYVELN